MPRPLQVMELINKGWMLDPDGWWWPPERQGEGRTLQEAILEQLRRENQEVTGYLVITLPLRFRPTAEELAGAAYESELEYWQETILLDPDVLLGGTFEIREAQ